MGIAILPAREKKVKKSVASLKAIRKKAIDDKKKKTKKKTGGRTKSNQDMQQTADISRLYDILKGVINPKYLKKETAMKANKGGKVSRKKIR